MDCTISRRGSIANLENTNLINSKSLIKVTSEPNIYIYCKQGDKQIKQFTDSEGQTEFSVGFGEWILECTTSNGKTFATTIDVSVLRIYNVYLYGTTYGVKLSLRTDEAEYTDDAKDFTTSLTCNINGDGKCDYGDWENIITDFIGCKPCLFKEGIRTCYLNPNNYAQKINDDGEFEDVDITSGDSGDVMVEFKRTWYRFYQEDGYLHFQVSDYDRSEEGFVTSAFSNKEYMYYGAYEGSGYQNEYSGSDTNNYLRTPARSLSGVYPVTAYNGNSTNSIELLYGHCVLNGESYGMEDLIRRSYIIGLLMLVTKTKDIPSAIGYGNCDTVADTGTRMSTGALNTMGLFAGFGNTSKNSVKCFGIENLWGNVWSACYGAYCTDSLNSSNGEYNTIRLSNKYTVYRLGLTNASNWVPSLMDANDILFPSGYYTTTNYNLGYIRNKHILPTGCQCLFVGGCCSCNNPLNFFIVNPSVFGSYDCNHSGGSNNYGHYNVRLMAYPIS